MKNIDGLLEKFRKQLNSRDVLIKAVTNAVKAHTGIQIDQQSFIVQESVLVIKKLSSVKKNEILLKKEKILQEVNGQFPKLVISTILMK